MSNALAIIFVIIIVFLLLVILNSTSKNSNASDDYKFSEKDEEHAKHIVNELKKMLESGEHIPDVDDETLSKMAENIYMHIYPEELSREGLEISNTAENIKYWPTYYYSFPYTQKQSGVWPPGMYSRLYYWSPGFYTGSGWQFQMRPGIGYKYWPRNRWIRKASGGAHGKNSYYYVTNADDYIHNAANYNEPPIIDMN